MSEVIVHRLAGSKKALEACRLVERLYHGGKRVAVWVADGGRAGVLDEYLWTFAQSSFVPHALWDGSGELDDPVAIVTGTLANPNRADVLVIGDRLARPDRGARLGPRCTTSRARPRRTRGSARRGRRPGSP